jgi:hypothetical protein
VRRDSFLQLRDRTREYKLVNEAGQVRPPGRIVWSALTLIEQ